jgi:hypothetical protein
MVTKNFLRNREYRQYSILVCVALLFSAVFARFSLAAEDSFKILVSDNGSKLIDSNGNPLGTLPIWQGVAYPLALSDDGSRLLYVSNASYAIFFDIYVYDVKTGESSFVINAPWCQTIKWLPNSSSKFLFAADLPNYHLGSLFLCDLDTKSYALWQDTDTIGYRVYRQGLDWDAHFNEIVFQAGTASSAGDQVFVGHYCEDDPHHHICEITNLTQKDYPGANMGYSPFITKDGSTVFSGLWNGFTMALVAQNIVTGESQEIMANQLGYPAGYIAPFDLYKDKYLILDTFNPANSNMLLQVCTIDAFSCRIVYEGNPHTFAAAIAFNPDNIPPSTTASVSPGTNANGWNNTDVNVT